MSARHPSALQRGLSRSSAARRSFSRTSTLQQPVFLVERTQGVERAYLGSKRLDKAHRYKQPQGSTDASLLATDRHFGARVVSLAAPRTHNALDIALVRAVRKHLERLEKNSAVTIVILQGQTDGLFSSGTDLARLQALAKGEGAYAGAAADVRVVAMQHLQEQYRLHHLVASYAKPIVAGMTGTVEGSAWALGQHAAYPYVADSTTLRFPEVSAGTVPHGGASYYLSRVPDGVGMWAALTGAPINGEAAYWAGLAPLYGSAKDVRETVLKEAGDHSADVACGTQLNQDPVYRRAMAALRMFRGEAQSIVADEEDDLSAEMYDEYYRLQRWYQLWSTGDGVSASAVLNNEEEPIEIGPMSEGDYLDRYRGADSRRQLYDSRFGSEHEGSYDNEPSPAVAERRARIGAVSAHAAAIFKGELRKGPLPDTVAKLGVVQRCFDGSAGDPSVLVADAAAPSAEDKWSQHVLEVEYKAKYDAAAAAGGKQAEGKPRLDRAWLKRLPSAGGAAKPSKWEARVPFRGMKEGGAKEAVTPASTTLSTADPLREYLLRSMEHTGLVHDADLTEMHLTGGTDDTLHTLSPALPAVPLSAVSEMAKACVEASWPNGQVSDAQVYDIASMVLGGEHPMVLALRIVNEVVAQEDAGAEGGEWDGEATAAKAVLPDAQLGPRDLPHAHNLADLLYVTCARVTARLHGVGEWTLVHPDIVSEMKGRVADVVGQANSKPDSSTIQGPNGYTIPSLERTLVATGEEAGEGPNQVLPMNPRMFSDAEGLIETPSEVDDDFMWPYHRGQWTGDIEGYGLHDAIPIVPDNVLGLKPALRADPIGRAVDVLRTDVLRFLNVALGTRQVQSLYVNTAAAYAAGAQDAVEGAPAAVDGVAALRARVLGKAGEAKVRTIMARYAREEGPVEAEEDLDVDVPGSRRQRATMRLAWPAMRSAVRTMRLIVLQGMAASCNFALSKEDATALVDAEADTVGGRLHLAELDATYLDSAGKYVRLIELYAALVKAATPKPRAPPVKDMYESPDPAGDLPAGLPNVNLTDAAKEELRAAAQRFSAWEAVVLGGRAGGDWIMNAPSKPDRFLKYTLAWTVDKESGKPRLTLQRQVSSNVVKVTRSAGGGAAASTSTPPPPRAASSASASTSIPADAVPLLGPFRDVGEARRKLLRLTYLGEDVGAPSGAASDRSKGHAGGASPDALSLLQGAEAEGEAARRASKRGSALDDLSTADVPDHLDSMSGQYARSNELSEEDVIAQAKEEVMGDALPDGNLSYRQPLLEEPAATEAARELGITWDWDVVRDALTDTTGEGVARMFSLPLTGRTMGTGAMVVDYFRKEADGRLVAPKPQSVEDIMARLAHEAGGRPFGLTSTKDARAGGAGAARRAEKQYASVAAAFAAQSLEQLQAQPAGALRATHALLMNAATVPLHDAMAMEYRALSRLLGLGGAPGAPKFDAHDAKIDTQALFAPLPAFQELSLEGPGFNRKGAMALRAAREQSQARWEAALEQHLAHGEGGGAIGDMFRRRYMYAPHALATPDYADDSAEGEGGEGAGGDGSAPDKELVEKVVKEVEEDRKKAGLPDTFTTAFENFRNDELWAYAVTTAENDAAETALGGAEGIARVYGDETALEGEGFIGPDATIKRGEYEQYLADVADDNEDEATELSGLIQQEEGRVIVNHALSTFARQTGADLAAVKQAHAAKAAARASAGPQGRKKEKLVTGAKAVVWTSGVELSPAEVAQYASLVKDMRRKSGGAAGGVRPPSWLK